MEVYTSDSSDSDSRDKSLDYGHSNLSEDYMSDNFNFLYKSEQSYGEIETILLNHNSLNTLPASITKFYNLKVLDLSSNGLVSLPDCIMNLPLTSLIVKNNFLTNKSLPKNFTTKSGGFLKELNLSGNKLEHFPDQALELKNLRYLYLGGNRISTISKDIYKLRK